jgi:hypothetical protein
MKDGQNLILQSFQCPQMLPSRVCRPSTTLVPPLPHLQVPYPNDPCITSGNGSSILYYLQPVAFLHRPCLSLAEVPFNLQATLY